MLFTRHQSTDPIKMCMNSDFYAVVEAPPKTRNSSRDKPHLKAIPELDDEGRILSIRKRENLVKELKHYLMQL